MNGPDGYLMVPKTMETGQRRRWRLTVDDERVDVVRVSLGLSGVCCGHVQQLRSYCRDPIISMSDEFVFGCQLE
jgi:hypothetical protein